MQPLPRNFVLGMIAAPLVLALASCAAFLPAAGGAVAGAGAAAALGGKCTPAPAHWPMCRDACAKRGATAARIDGSVNPDQLPQCSCGFPDPT